MMQEMEIKGKKIILRVDFNVPLKDSKIEDDKRIRTAIPTIDYLLKEKVKQIILISHLGRPEGKNLEYSLKPIAERLSKLINKKVLFINDCINIKIPDTPKIVLLENLRFYEEEKNNDPLFARKLAAHGDIYINEAFSNSHRAHASMVGIPKLLPSGAGMQLQKELEHLTLKHAQHPFIAIMGGAKVAGKIPLIKNLLKNVDVILLGGAMIFTFYKAEGFEIGKSIFEPESLDAAKELLSCCEKRIILPIDIVTVKKVDKEARTDIKEIDMLSKDDIGVDIGHKTIYEYKEIIEHAETIFWNGPMGMFEIDNFASGTNEIAETLAFAKGKTIVGGGDTVAAIEKLGLESKFTHLSTGGGAALTFLEGNEMPALTALDESERVFT